MKQCRISQAKRNFCSWNRAALLFLLPGIFGTTIFYVIPLLEIFRRSFSDPMGKGFAGLANYSEVIHNGAFRLAFGNTMRFLAAGLPLILVAGLLFALLVRKVEKTASRAAGWWKFFSLLPLAVPAASMVLLWRVLFSDMGMVNTALDIMGVSIRRWLSQDSFALLLLTFLWKNLGFTALFLGIGLAQIPEDIYEAGMLDGAGVFQRFWHLTFPLLLPILRTTMVFILLNSFKIYREIYLIGGEYPDTSIYQIQHLFSHWFQNVEYEKISAAAVLLVLILGLVIVLIEKSRPRKRKRIWIRRQEKENIAVSRQEKENIAVCRQEKENIAVCRKEKKRAACRKEKERAGYRKGGQNE